MVEHAKKHGQQKHKHQRTCLDVLGTFQNLNKFKARAQKNIEVAADKNEAAKEEKK